MYSASSVTGNLKEFGLKDQLGRKRTSISTGTLIFKSILGDKEKRVVIDEF